MIDFSIVGKVDFKLESKWLDEFRKKYDRPIPCHITLKNSTYLESGNELEVLELLKRISIDFKPIRLNFKKIRKSETSSGWCLFLEVVEDKQVEYLRVFQKIIKEKFARFGNPIKIAYVGYETNFNPHITIASRLNLTQLGRAMEEINLKDTDRFFECEINFLQLVWAKVDNGVEVDSTRSFIDIALN
jgi:2'-5' RNA ligase